VETIVKSPTQTVIIGPNQPFVISGERINPTGRTPSGHQRWRAQRHPPEGRAGTDGAECATCGAAG